MSSKTYTRQQGTPVQVGVHYDLPVSTLLKVSEQVFLVRWVPLLHLIAIMDPLPQFPVYGVAKAIAYLRNHSC